MDVWTAVIVGSLLIVGVVVALHFLRKKNPQAADQAAAVGTAAVDAGAHAVQGLVALSHSLVDKLHQSAPIAPRSSQPPQGVTSVPSGGAAPAVFVTNQSTVDRLVDHAASLGETVKQQAAVIASPPIQAAVNGGTQYYDADGTPNAKGQYQAWQLPRLTQERADEEHRYTGPVAATSLMDGSPSSLNDAAYLYHAATNYGDTLAPDGSLRRVHFAVLSGTRQQISDVINLAGSTNASFTAQVFNPATYEGQFKPLVQQVINGTLKVND